MLSAIVFLPLAGALLTAVFVRNPRLVRLTAAIFAVVTFGLSLVAFASYDLNKGGLQLEDIYANWIPVEGFPVRYHLGVDGLSLPLVLLTALLGLCSVFVSWGIQTRVKEHYVWLLVLQTAVTGVFTSLDLVMFFLFWEMELIPMYLLIAIWGGGRREYSAMKFLIFTITGSAFMLVGILVVFFSVGTFSLAELAGLKPGVEGLDSSQLLLSARFVFLLFFIAFAIKLPVWPVHTWLPDAHTDAPTAGSVMLAGVLIKMGGYGLIRISLGMFPQVARDLALFLAILAVINILYGALVTLRQTDLKRLIAYSSISHMGYVLLGVSSVGAAGGALSPLGVAGAATQMFTHGTITGLLFTMVGLVYDKTHTRHIPDLGGLASRVPFTASIFVIAGLAALGLPSLSGFVSEVMVFLGTFPVWGVITALGALGIVVTAGYILWMLLRVFFGPAQERFVHLEDASLVERVAPVLLLISIVAVGLYPRFLTDLFTSGAAGLLASRFGGSG
ncbi:MAG: NADH-quinone oxidoreductase subunit M [Chloroflexi bacterium]|nr:NADH-quinone oxidoreductase subunit M [Chloroflexota bacterium]